MCAMIPSAGSRGSLREPRASFTPIVSRPVPAAHSTVAFTHRYVANP